ncbi:hypothetical protein BDV93DRAFT_606117 [Ceratobasidium sp. AG-I]|nr:hypothetical protein BDV93DRAFT_606117 [Ceratobasidium sp. AG-I]
MALYTPGVQAKASRNVLNTPELLSHICTFSRPLDLVRLCRASRSAFHTTMPLIWRNVDGAHNLLALLPGTHVSKPNYQKGRYYRRITLPDTNLTTFERFNFYAPFVRHLSVYSKNTYYSEVVNPDILSQHARLRPLLPNLLSITMQTKCADYHSADQLSWIADFISPSLISFWSDLDLNIAWPGRIPELAILVLLDPILERCTAIERLAIYPRAGSMESYELRPALGSSTFSHLRELSGSATLAGVHMLQAVSMLPQLERLSILASYQYFPEVPTELPPGSFPKLKHLTLNTRFLEDALSIATMRPMLCRLTSLDVCIDPFTNWDGVSDFTVGILGVVLVFLENSPRLRKFVFNTDPDENGYVPLIVYEQTLLTHLARLESLSLTSIILGPSAFQEPEMDWSSLKELNLPAQHAVLETHLPYFAKIKCLERLTLSLYHGNNDIKPLSIPVSNVSLDTLESKTKPEEWCKPEQVDEVARFLLSIWPSLRRVVCAGDEAARFTSDTFGQVSVTEDFVTLNERLCILKTQQSH